MLLLNPTDQVMVKDAAVRAPDVNGGQEAIYPPRTFRFEPGDMLEVPQEAGNVLLEHLGRRGLVQVTFHADKDEMELHVLEQREVGRRAWFVWLEQQVGRHKQLAEEQRQKGLSPVRPNPDILACYRIWDRLRKTPEFSDPILADASVPTMTGEERAALLGDTSLLTNAQREAARQAELGA